MSIFARICSIFYEETHRRKTPVKIQLLVFMEGRFMSILSCNTGFYQITQKHRNQPLEIILKRENYNSPPLLRVGRLMAYWSAMQVLRDEKKRLSMNVTDYIEYRRLEYHWILRFHRTTGESAHRRQVHESAITWPPEFEAGQFIKFSRQKGSQWRFLWLHLIC